jgi:signal transduction histidine kinase
MLPYPWRLSLSVARTALGTGCLALHIVYSRSPFSWGLLPLVVFLLYTGFALRRSQQTSGQPLLTLTIDTCAFLVWFVLTANSSYGGVFWTALAVANYLFLLSSAVLNHEWLRVVAVAGVCLITVVALPAPSRASVGPVMAWCAILTTVWMLNRHYLETRLSRASRHSVMYRFEAQQAREEERQRIAADFHDGPLQSFIGLQMRLEILKKMLARDPQLAAEELLQLQELCKSQVGELRAFVRSMRPADVEGSSLGASISRMVEQFQKDTGVSTSFLSGEYVNPAETEVSLEILQIVREALNNVQKHSRASRVAVALNKAGNFLEISIEDNGEGFPFSGSYTLDELDLLRVGPVSIRHRVRALGGELNVQSRPGQGSGLKVRVAIS